MSLNQCFLTRTPWQIKYSACSMFPGSCTTYKGVRADFSVQHGRAHPAAGTQPRAQPGVSPPPTQNTYTTVSESTHPGRAGSYGRLLQKSERGKKVGGQQLLQGRAEQVQCRGRRGKKNPKNKLKRRQRGDAGIRGSDVYLLGNSQHRRGKGELVFGLWGFFFWCHSR